MGGELERRRKRRTDEKRGKEGNASSEIKEVKLSALLAGWGQVHGCLRGDLRPLEVRHEMLLR